MKTKRLMGGRVWLAAGWVILLASQAMAEKTVLRLRLSGPVMEAPDQAAGMLALFSKEEMRTLREWVGDIRRAAADRDISGLALIIEEPEINLAQVEELVQAIQAFKARGKPVYCYLDYADNVSYALAAAASHITIAENGELAIVGLHGEMMFFKGLLDKLGLEADMMQCGAYKGAAEPFTRTEPSPEVVENINWLLDGLYERWIGLIAEGRKLPVEEVKKLVDAAPLSAEQALKYKLVDEVSSFPTFKQMLHKEFGRDLKVVKRYEESSVPEVDTSNPFAFLSQLFGLLQEAASPEEKPAIGLIYIEGTIMVGPSDDSPLGGSSAGSSTIRSAFEQARQDDQIRAVVVRVDSPGGSALASDIIWEAATRCGLEKPVIVSMGAVAGSGGYYVSIPGDVIFADPSTITGSIGVVGGKLIWKQLMEGKLGITTAEFSRGRHAGLMSMNRKWNEAERAWMTDYLNRVYDQFKDRVKKSRGQRLKKDLQEIAGGRVYTGAQAVELGLVDRLGGLSDALDFAATRAGLGKDYEVRTLPKPSGFAAVLKLLKSFMGEEGEDEFEIEAQARLDEFTLLRAARPVLRELAPAQLKHMLQALRNLTILQREHVGCFMPLVPQVR